ncbi:MAG: cobalamin-dependent protein [Deltaproteobacteria bacterium]|nr:cobalamin-dependent protein [Deltaproteobacteria bacterium]
MSEKVNQDDLIHLMADLQEESVLDLVKKRLADGIDPLQIIDFCHKGVHLVGERYERGIYFLSGLIMAGEIMREVGALTLPLIERNMGEGNPGRLVLGTVEGDIHFIGKDIFKVLIQCHGFTVHDLGVDVSPGRFLSAIKEFNPDIIGLSCLVGSAYHKIGETITLLRENVSSKYALKKYILGGLIDERICKKVEADYWVKDAMEGVRICQRIMKSNKTI